MARGVIRKDFVDLGYTVIAEPEPYYVRFSIYEHMGTTEDGKALLHRAGAASNLDTVETIEEADVYMNGDVKWDGCSNWSFDEQDRGIMLHGCSRADLMAIGEIMAACWDWTAELLPNWDYEAKGNHAVIMAELNKVSEAMKRFDEATIQGISGAQELRRAIEQFERAGK